MSNAITELDITPGDLKLDCIWVLPSNTGGFVIDHYKVYLNGTYYADSSTANIALTGLVNGTSYKVKIVPYTKVDYLTDDLMGTSYESVEYYPYKLASSVNNLEAVPTDNLVTLSWDAPAPSDNGGFEIAKYAVSYNNTPTIYVTGTTTAIVANNGEDITYTVTPVTININPLASLAELFGASDTVLSRAYTKPNPISNLQVIPSDSSIKLLFAPSSNNGGYDITYYKISYKIGSGEYTDVLITTGELVYEADKITYSFDAVNGSGYDIKIAVINAAATINISTDVTSSVSQIPYRASSAVTDLVVTATDKQLHVEWNPPTPTDTGTGGFPIDHYDIYINGIYKDTTNNTTTDKVITGLINGQYYVISIIPVTIPDYTSVNLDGDEAFAPSIKPYTIPDTVNTLTVVEKDKEIVLSWTTPVITGGNSIVGYDVNMTDALGDVLFSDTIDDASILNYTFNTINVSNIANGYTYTLNCRVITQTDNNESLYSTYQSIDAKPYGKPLEITYSIDILTNIITVFVNNNGFHLSGILIVAPVSTDSVNNDLAHILVQNTLANPIEQQISLPLYDKFTVHMDYQLAEISNQAIIIIVTNSAGMNFVQNFSTIV